LTTDAMQVAAPRKLSWIYRSRFVIEPLLTAVCFEYFKCLRMAHETPIGKSNEVIKTHCAVEPGPSPGFKLRRKNRLLGGKIFV